jgi:hypothetical protein
MAWAGSTSIRWGHSGSAQAGRAGPESPLAPSGYRGRSRRRRQTRCPSSTCRRRRYHCASGRGPCRQSWYPSSDSDREPVRLHRRHSIRWVGTIRAPPVVTFKSADNSAWRGRSPVGRRRARIEANRLESRACGRGLSKHSLFSEMPYIMSGGIPNGAPLSSGISVMTASVVRTMAAIDAAFWSADRVTLAGSTIPALNMSVYLLLRAS